MNRPVVESLLAGAVILAAAACGADGARINNEGNDAFTQHDYEAALDSYDEAVRVSPELAEPHYNSGNVHHRQQDHEAAQRSYEQSLLQADEDLYQDTLFNLGNTQLQADELESAIESYKEALRLDPNDREAKHNLELALRRLTPDEQQQEQERSGEEQETGQQDEQAPPQAGQQPEQQGQGEREGGDDPQEQQGDTGGEQQPEDSRQPSPTETTELTEEQARQLLAVVGESTDTLQNRLQRTLDTGGRQPEQDW